MYKLLIMPLMLVIWMTLYIQGIDQELSMKTYYKGKQAVNRGAHAAALQLNEERLSEGEIDIDPQRARMLAEQYIYQNLHLDASGQPTRESFISKPVVISHFELLDSTLQYPYHYELTEYNYEVIFERPAVIIVMELVYPSIFSRDNPVKWNIIGSSQVVSQ